MATDDEVRAYNNVRGKLAETQADLRAWIARGQSAEAAISSVRALHAEPHECPEWDDAHGWVTGWFSGGGCPTIAALNSSGTVEDAPGGTDANA